MQTVSFYDTTIRNSRYFRSDDVCKDPAMLEPGTRAAVAALMDEAKSEGHDLRLLETYRSQTRQSYLFTKHVTQLRVVGCHGYGVAADFGVFINGKYAEDNGPYVFLRQLARKHGLISGQDWGHAKSTGFVDSGHVQRVPVWRQGQLFSGMWYPPAQYDPYTDSAGSHPDVVASLSGAPAAPPNVVQTSKAPQVEPTEGSVVWVQMKLNEWAPSFKLDVSGVLDGKTEYAIKRLQQVHHMPDTGKLDPETLKKIAAS